MKKDKLILLVLTFMLAACSDKKNQETIDYYLSQPKDAELLGWWKWNLEDESALCYWYFKESGTIGELPYMDGKTLQYSELRYYWYTEKNDRKILHRFHPYGGLYASENDRDYYKIENVLFGYQAELKDINFFMN